MEKCLNQDFQDEKDFQDCFDQISPILAWKKVKILIQTNPENPQILKILIQTNFTNIGMEKVKILIQTNPENPQILKNPDSDKFHQYWHGKR